MTTNSPDSLQQMESQNLVIALADLKKEVDLLKEIQTRLKALGLYTIAIDGLWGPSTENAMDQFCDSVHLNCMDTGLFGPTFAKALLETQAVDNPGPYGLPTWWQGGNKDQLALAVAKEGKAQGVTDRNQLCYIMATIQHETAATYKPIAEYGGARQRYAPYYGRGYVQLTWKYNYEKYGTMLHQDFVNHPDLVMQPDVSLFIIVNGMKDGIFTGKKLSDYISGSRVDFVNARRIINGLDRADLIAGYAQQWQQTQLF
ncbi:MAG: glycoside hydrolase family 19 protein [Merismopediaceae bacterium]|nr:glycoside hydrolase family 19 protein [Merismopediaceae bacterium]